MADPTLLTGFGAVAIYPNDLLSLLEKQLKEGGTPTGSNLPGAGLSDLAFLSLWSDEQLMDNPRGKQFVALRPNRFPLWQSVIQGAGAPLVGSYTIGTSTGFNTVVTLSCFAQINADPELRNTQAITEQTLGVISFVLKVIRAVQFWQPVDSNNACYLREPARMTDGGFGLSPRRSRGGDWWCHAPVDIELKFTAKFSDS